MTPERALLEVPRLQCEFTEDSQHLGERTRKFHQRDLPSAHRFGQNLEFVERYGLYLPLNYRSTVDLADECYRIKRTQHRVQKERWLAGSSAVRRRVDMIVDECVAIELKYMIHKKGAGERDRVHEQIIDYARVWQSSGPVLLFLAGTPRGHATRFGEIAQDWNARLSGDRAPIVVVVDK